MPENCYYRLSRGGCGPKARSTEGVALQCGYTVGQPQETWRQQTLQPFPMVIFWVLPALWIQMMTPTLCYKKPQPTSQPPLSPPSTAFWLSYHEAPEQALPLLPCTSAFFSSEIPKKRESYSDCNPLLDISLHCSGYTDLADATCHYKLFRGFAPCWTEVSGGLGFSHTFCPISEHRAVLADTSDIGLSQVSPETRYTSGGLLSPFLRSGRDTYTLQT